MSIDLKKTEMLRLVALERVEELKRIGIDGWSFDLLELVKEVLNYTHSLEERVDRLERVLNIRPEEAEGEGS